MAHPVIPGAKVRVETGHTIEVAFTFKNSIETKVIDWTSEDITLVLTNINNNGTVISTVEASGITFDTSMIEEFENGKVGETEMSGQAEEMKRLV